jgi:arginine/lysine/ornithine decarboxylase
VSDSIRTKHQFDSNVIDENDLQFEKHSDPRISTLLGIKIDSSDENENASDLICVKREFDSNMMDESDLQHTKQCDPRISTFCGIIRD